MSLPAVCAAFTPDYKIITGIIVLLLLLCSSALISASEVAFFSLKPEDLEKLRNNKSQKAKNALKMYNMPERLLSTILISNNTVNIAFVLLAAFLSARLFDFSSRPVLGFIVEAIGITFLILLFGEIMPKVYASKNHIILVILMASPLVALEKLFRPISSLLVLSTSFVKKRTGIKKTNISMDDLSEALELASDDINEDEKIIKRIDNG